MNEVRSCKYPELELLHQIFVAATHEASAAMCRWTDGLITLALDEVREVPIEQVAPMLEIGDELLTMVVLALEGEIGGDMILAFDEQNGRALAASLLGRPVEQAPQWSEMERSALTETGNILGCAYMNALTRVLDCELVPSPPYFVQDFGASVLEQALMAQAADTDNVLVCRTRFHRAGRQLDWHVIFFPTQAMRRSLDHAIRIA